MIKSVLSKLCGFGIPINNEIPVLYILGFIIDKIIEIFWGVTKFRRLRLVFVKRTAKIDCANSIKFGQNLRIGSYSYINALSKDGIEIGNNVSFGMYSSVICTGTLFGPLGKGLKIGNNVGMGTHGFWGCAGGIEIGNDTIMGNYVTAHSENHNFDDISKPIREQGVNRKGIKIGNGCWICSKVTILDGTIIGDGVIVAAGSVVKGIIPSNCIVAGVPAKIVKYRGNHTDKM